MQLRHHINALHRDVVHFSSAWKQITSGITLRPKDRTSPSIQLPTDILKNSLTVTVTFEISIFAFEPLMFCINASKGDFTDSRSAVQGGFN